MTQHLENSSKSQTLLSLLNNSNVKASSTYSSGISKLDSTLEGSHGFKKGCLYDINCVPGIVGMWPLIFQVMFSCLSCKLSQGKKKILVFQNLNKIPWFQFKNSKHYKVEYKSLIDILEVKTLVQLIVILQEVDFSNYEMVIIDGFHELYQSAQMNIKIARNGGDLLTYTSDGGRSLNRNGLKRDIMGQPVINPGKKLGMILQEIMVILGSIATTNNLFFIATGKLEPHTQKIPEESLECLHDDDSDDEVNNKDRYFIQRVLVPVISLTEPSSNYFTNRIILFKDWLINDPASGDVTSGIDKSLNINDYIRLMESNNVKTSPHFLCTSNHSGSIHFTSGWFQVNNESCDLIDSEAIIGVKQYSSNKEEEEEEEVGPALEILNASNQTVPLETSTQQDSSSHFAKRGKFIEPQTFSKEFYDETGIIPESQC